MTLTNGQKRQVLIKMIYENDNKFLALLTKMLRAYNIKNTTVSVPMGYSFLRNSNASRAQFSILNGTNKNWLNYMTDVELLHYLDFQNRFYDELRQAHCTSAEDFFKKLEKASFNMYYTKSADCPKLQKKLEVPSSEKLSEDKVKDPAIRQQVLLDTMLKAHNLKQPKGKEAKAITTAIAGEFAIDVKVPTVTQQMIEKKQEAAKETKPTLRFAGTVYEVPIYWNGSYYVFADGSSLNKEYRDYIAAGELRHEQDIDTSERLDTHATSMVEEDDYILDDSRLTLEGTLYDDPIYSRRDARGFIEYCHGDGSPLSKQEQALLEAGELKSIDDEMADD